jgi:HEAT repeat protein
VRQERLDYDRDITPVKDALTAAGIDPTDISRFVNRVVPGVIAPSHFDGPAAVPVLLQWLPRISNEMVKDTIVRRLRTPAAKKVAVDALLAEFTSAHNDGYKWVVGDALAYVADAHSYPDLVELAADRRHGKGRQMLIDMLWRVKTDRADEVLLAALTDPDVTLQAVSALRRRLGNEAARPHIAGLTDHADPHVRDAARRHLKRVDKHLSRAT